MQETQVQALGREDPLEKEMATHSSILVWKIPWTEEPGRLQSMVLQTVRYNIFILNVYFISRFLLKILFLTQVNLHFKMLSKFSNEDDQSFFLPSKI